MATFTEEQVLRLMELAVYEATGEMLGCSMIARQVFSHYEDEDGKVRAYVDEYEGDMDDLDIS